MGIGSISVDELQVGTVAMNLPACLMGGDDDDDDDVPCYFIWNSLHSMFCVLLVVIRAYLDICYIQELKPSITNSFLDVCTFSHPQANTEISGFGMGGIPVPIYLEETKSAPDFKRKKVSTLCNSVHFFVL